MLPLKDALNKIDDTVVVAVLPDHPTPCKLRTHSADSVPFVIYYNGINADDVDRFDEQSAKIGSYGELKCDEFIKKLIIKN